MLRTTAASPPSCRLCTEPLTEAKLSAFALEFGGEVCIGCNERVEQSLSWLDIETDARQQGDH